MIMMIRISFAGIALPEQGNAFACIALAGIAFAGMMIAFAGIAFAGIDFAVRALRM